jgi:hypothetical protein
MTLCVPFDRSLGLLKMQNRCGPYGYEVAGESDCEGGVWGIWQREGWIDGLRQAQADLKRDLGAPLCPEQICGERHNAHQKIRLRQAPVAYMGMPLYSEWTEEELTLDPDRTERYITICEADLDGASPESVEFDYPEDVAEVYRGRQTVQQPRINDVADCDGLGNPGYRFTWHDCKMVKPFEMSAMPSHTEKFLTHVRWRTAEVDESLAAEWVNDCNCSVCTSGVDTTPQVELTDATEGFVTMVNVRCHNWHRRQVRLNYATAYGCNASIDPMLEQAVVILAVLKTGKTPVKPCGCDNTYIEWLLQIDPTAGNDFAHKLTYGPTNAGMEVMRTLDRLKNRPHFNQPVESGGMLTGRSHTRKGRRLPSFLRGF